MLRNDEPRPVEAGAHRRIPRGLEAVDGSDADRRRRRRCRPTPHGNAAAVHFARIISRLIRSIFHFIFNFFLNAVVFRR